jgi:hypothetical protein
MPTKRPAAPGPLETGCTREEIVVSASNFQSLKRLERARAVTEGHVGEIAAALRSGVHFDSPISVNRVTRGSNGHAYRIIDGNHRVDAIFRVLSTDPTFTIRVPFDVYHGLTEEQEFDLFEKLNNVRRQTVGQRIQLHGYPLWQMITRDFPCSVWWDGLRPRNSFGGVSLLRSYASTKTAASSLGASWDTFHSLVATKASDTYRDLSDFAKSYIQGFGEPDAKYPLCRATALAALMRVYFANLKAGATREKIVEAWKARVSTNNQLLRELQLLGLAHGSSHVKHAEEAIVDSMRHSGSGFVYPSKVLPPSSSVRWRTRQAAREGS